MPVFREEHLGEARHNRQGLDTRRRVRNEHRDVRERRVCPLAAWDEEPIEHIAGDRGIRERIERAANFPAGISKLKAAREHHVQCGPRDDTEVPE